METQTERKQRFINSTFFEVGSQMIDGKRWIVNQETGRQISQVSERYTLVKNRELVQPIVEHFGANALTSLRIFGKSYAYTFETGRNFNFGDGDDVKERLVVVNSYDKSKSFRFMFGAFRMVCSNGLYTGHAVINYRKIHIGNIPVQDITLGVIDNYQNNSFANWYEMKKVSMTLEAQVNFIKNLKLFDVDETEQAQRQSWNPLPAVVNNRSIERFATRFLSADSSADNQRNAWGLFNQVNRAIAYTLPGGNVQGRITANLRAEEAIMTELVPVRN